MLDLKRFDTGSANPTINRNLIHPERVAFPRYDEQATIVAYIDKITKDLGITIAATQHEISLLREYRTRLIADVVTGKMDVRHISLPDESNIETIFGEDIEPLDNETCALDEVECAVEIEE